MGKIIEVRLSDAQHAQLVAEAEASGQKFFEYCRAKLTDPASRRTLLDSRVKVVAQLPVVAQLSAKPLFQAGDATPSPAAIAALRTEDDDRISRIEEAIANLTNYVLHGQQPVPEQAQPQQPIDVDSLVNEQFAEAEAQGLTQYVPDPVQEVMAVAGVRPLQKRAMPFAPANTPRHLQGMV